MPSNVEIKAKVRDMKAVEEIASKLSDEPKKILLQEDTFFNVKNGRLKLRQEQADGLSSAELIYYDRPDKEGPKTSYYHKTDISQPEDLKTTLSYACDVRGRVKKRRILYMVGQTRVHLDKVEGLGDFMELEVKMKEDQPTEEGQMIAEDLMNKLGIEKSDLINCAYQDLLVKQKLQKPKQTTV